MARLRLGAGPSPEQRVEVVRSAYGALLGDIVYRIENSALFDAAVEETARFQVSLLAWESGRDDAAASEVEESFRIAQRHAESLGLIHLPATARGTALRAAKSARVALASDSAQERLAAARAAAGLLRARWPSTTFQLSTRRSRP